MVRARASPARTQPIVPLGIATAYEQAVVNGRHLKQQRGEPLAMCGICGVVNWEGPDMDAVRAMSSAMVHRGPNADGLIIRTPAVLAHRRLSIIDLSDEANQPMMDESGRYFITYNGEIYNYRAIRTDLEKIGVRFRTHSDTEVLLYAYIIWGLECLQRLNGMF